MDRREFLTVTSVAGLGLCVAGPGLAAESVSAIPVIRTMPIPGLRFHGSARSGCTGAIGAEDFPSLPDVASRR
jgi:hypothetical protein